MSTIEVYVSRDGVTFEAVDPATVTNERGEFEKPPWAHSIRFVTAWQGIRTPPDCEPTDEVTAMRWRRRILGPRK